MGGKGEPQEEAGELNMHSCQDVTALAGGGQGWFSQQSGLWILCLILDLQCTRVMLVNKGRHPLLMLLNWPRNCFQKETLEYSVKTNLQF